MAETINYRFKVAGKPAATLASDNPTPLERELVVETDTGQIKLGDGVTAWGSLPYFLVASSVAWSGITGKPTTLTAAGITANGNDWSGADLAIADGGTGASTAGAARTNLGLGTAATQATGTSGTVVPLLDGANTWSSVQVFQTSTAAPASFRSSDANGVYVTWRNVSSSTTIGDVGASAQIVSGSATDFCMNSRAGNVILATASGGRVQVTSGGIEPYADDTYYVGRNSSSSPKAFKGLILKDTSNGNYYRLQVTAGVVNVVAL